MVILSFEITFLGPFHVARGQASAGLDRTVDRTVPLPASSLKGLLRGEAKDRLRIDDTVLNDVFGAPRHACPWTFGDATLVPPAGENGVKPSRAARIKLDDEGQVSRSFLQLGEHLWAPRATFAIEQAAMVAEVDVHVLVITAAAQSVSSLGGGRRRGEGWVSIRRLDSEPWDERQSARLLTLRRKDGP